MGLNIDKFTRAGLEPRTSGLASQTFYPVTFYVACHRLDFVNVMQIFILFFYPLHQFVLALYTYTPEFCEKNQRHITRMGFEPTPQPLQICRQIYKGKVYC